MARGAWLAIAPLLTATACAAIFGVDDLAYGEGDESASSPGTTGSGASSSSILTGGDDQTGGAGGSTSGASGGDGAACALRDCHPPLDCQQGCADLYACGLLLCDDQTLCPGFGEGGSQANEVEFLQYCEAFCSGVPDYLALIDPCDCPGTIEAVKRAEPQYFPTICEEGCSFGGARPTPSAGWRAALLVLVAVWYRRRRLNAR